MGFRLVIWILLPLNLQRIPDQFCIQAHSSSLRCGGSLCKVRYDAFLFSVTLNSIQSRIVGQIVKELTELTPYGILPIPAFPNQGKEYLVTLNSIQSRIVERFVRG